MNAKKRCVLVLGVTIPGSVWLLRGQSAWFEENGYVVHLLSAPGMEAESYCKQEGCIHHDVSIARQIDPVADVRTLVSLVRLFRRLRPEVVNVGTPKMGLLGMIAAWLCRVPRRVYTCRGLRYEHENGFRRHMLMATEWLAGVCAQDVICIAPSVRDRAVADGVFRESKVRVIGDGSSNGINLEKYLRSSVDLGERGHMQEELGLQGHFVYGFVGRLVDRKGINELIAAFDRLYRDNSDIRLLLVGAEDSSQLSDLGLLEFIEKHPGIRSIGFSRKVPEALSLMDVFVLPSWWEGFGNAYLEAAAMGLPVIGTTGTGCRDAVKDGFNGVLVPIKDQDAVYWAMKRYLDDGELRKFHGGNGPQWAAHFRPETVWSGLKELYERFPRS